MSVQLRWRQRLPLDCLSAWVYPGGAEGHRTTCHLAAVPVDPRILLAPKASSPWALLLLPGISPLLHHPRQPIVRLRFYRLHWYLARRKAFSDE